MFAETFNGGEGVSFGDSTLCGDSSRTKLRVATKKKKTNLINYTVIRLIKNYR